MMLLTKEAILAAQDLKSEEVDVPEWGGAVRVRMLTGAERDAFGASMLGKDGKPDMSQYRTRLLAASVVGEDGQPLFGLADAEQLGAKSGAVLSRLFEVAEKLNGLSNASVEAAEKN